MPQPVAGGPLRRLEELPSIATLGLMAVLPLLEIAGRGLLRTGVPGSIILVQYLTLLAAFFGAGLAARSDRLLALATAEFLPERARAPVKLVTGAIAAAVSAWLAWAGVGFVASEREAAGVLAMGLPLWVVLCVMPLGFAGLAARLIWRAAPSQAGRLLAASALAVPVALTVAPSLQGGPTALILGLALGAATLLGLPIFAAVGGLALLLFWSDGTAVATVPLDAHRLTVHPVLPALPLFTLGGYVLSAGGASERLLRVFTSLFGWLPGGTALVAALVFAFFTSFTGASGVTILSLGGLLLPVLLKTGYPERFSLGLVTVSGSIGLLFVPSLPVILYGVSARQPIPDLFIAGFVPGLLLVLLVGFLGVRQGFATGAGRAPFAAREAAAALWRAKWEMLLPVLVLGGIFGGYTTVVEAAALTVLYAIASECVIHRDLSFRRDLPRVFVDCATLVGGFLIILGLAYGLTDYLIYAGVPSALLSWVQAHIGAKWLFLLALNVFLLIVGALMDIYSAILVVVPLITPLAAAYGVDPIHLGVIFLANLELGYLTPPMGENLFLSSYRFNQPVMRVFRATLPFYAALLGGVLLITYFPPLTLGLLRIWAR